MSTTIPMSGGDNLCVNKKYDISEDYLYKNSCSDLLWWGHGGAQLSWGRNAGNDPAQAVAAINMGPAFHTSVSTVSTVWNTSLVTSHCPWPTSPPPVSDGGKEVLQHWHGRPVLWLDHYGLGDRRNGILISLYAARDCANLQAFFNFLFWEVMATKKHSRIAYIGCQ